VIAAALYLQLLEFRKGSTKSSFFHLLTSSSIFAYSMCIIGGSFVVLNAFVAYSGVKDSYSWSIMDNMVYYGLSRPIYVLGCFMVLFAFFSGKLEIARKGFGNTYWIALGRLTYGVYLISPIVLTVLYAGTQRGLYTTSEALKYYGVGQILLSFVLSFLMFVFVEYPLKTCFGLALKDTLNPYSVIEAEKLKS